MYVFSKHDIFFVLYGVIKIYLQLLQEIIQVLFSHA